MKTSEQFMINVLFCLQRQIRTAKPYSPVWLVTEAFVTKWNQRIPKIRRWQFTWNAFNQEQARLKTLVLLRNWSLRTPRHMHHWTQL